MINYVINMYHYLLCISVNVVTLKAAVMNRFILKMYEMWRVMRKVHSA